MTRPKSVVILGAGIVGLSLAWHLRKNAPEPIEITLIDKSGRVGGMVNSETASSAIFELGPHTIRLAPPYKETCLQLFEQIGLSDEIITPDPSSKKRYLAYDGKLYPFPFSPIKLFHPTYFKKVLIPLFQEKNKTPLESKDPSIYDFFSHRFGRFIADYFVDPMVAGIFGGDPRSLSLKSCFPTIHRIKNQEGSLLINMLKHKRKNPTKMISFKRGLLSLPQTLLEKADPSLILNNEVKSLEFLPRPRLHLKDQVLECDHLFSCIPARSLYSLLEDQPLEHKSYLKELNTVSYKVIHIGFSKKLKIPKAFGFLTPSWKREKLAGVMFDSMIFPSHDSKKLQSRLTVLIHQNSPIFHLADDLLVLDVLEELKRYLKCDFLPSYQRVHFVNRAIPQYEVGHSERIDLLKEEIEQKIPQFSFSGSSFYGTALPCCINQGKKLALDYLKKNSYVSA